MDIDDNETVRQFSEKAKEDGGWINAGFMVLEPEVFDYIEGDDTFFEKEPLENLALDGKVVVEARYQKVDIECNGTVHLTVIPGKVKTIKL